MPVNQNDKSLIIDELENAATKASRLVINLKFAHRETEAAEALKKAKKLRAQLDGLLAASMTVWSGDGEAIIADMKQANQALQRDIADIRKKKDLANKAVKALGRLDDLIVKAKDMLAQIPIP